MSNRQIFALCMTVLWSIVFGTSMNSWTLGICMGTCFGIAFGLFGNKENDEKKGNDKDEE